MGLKISKQVKALGIDLSQLYCRLHIRFYFPGDKVDVWVQTYATKEAFKEDERNHFLIDGISRQYQFDYDRERDGVDILLFCHEKIKTLLSTDVVKQQETADKEGKVITKEVIVRERFADPEQIVIDLIQAK